MSAIPGNGVIEQAGAVNGSGPNHGDSGTAAADRRPEIAVGAAFAGGFLLALLLRRIRS